MAMAETKTTNVLIGGKIYTLSGEEDEAYLKQVADYINEKQSSIVGREEFKRISTEMKNVLVELNIANDYFKLRSQYESLQDTFKRTEKELFDMKHELVDSQMKVDELLASLEQEQGKSKEKSDSEKKLEESYRKLEESREQLSGEMKEVKEQLADTEELLKKERLEKEEQAKATEKELEAALEKERQRLSQQTDERTASLLEQVQQLEERCQSAQDKLRDVEQEKQALVSENKELRHNKKRLETVLEDALLGAKKQMEAKAREEKQKELSDPHKGQDSSEEFAPKEEGSPLRNATPQDSEGDLESASAKEVSSEEADYQGNGNQEKAMSLKEDAKEVTDSQETEELPPVGGEKQKMEVTTDHFMEPEVVDVSDEDLELQEIARQIEELERQEKGLT